MALPPNYKQHKKQREQAKKRKLADKKARKDQPTTDKPELPDVTTP